jgi:drug/metabolite transporter (DMT)-like permease
VGALLYIEPIVTMVAAALLLGEAVTPAALLGGAVILAGVRVATRR